MAKALFAVMLAVLGAPLAASPLVVRQQVALADDGSAIESLTLANDEGIEATILTYGATLQRLVAPDRNGRLEDVTLGFDDPLDYVRQRKFFGVTVGRYANRIANGRFTLDNVTYQLPTNNGPNMLHGGPDGFDRHNWRVVAVSAGETASVVLALTSPDGDMGFPGKLEATVTYTLDEDGSLSITMEAVADKPTIVSMTNHSLFNLAGADLSSGTSTHRLHIAASHFLPVDATRIPTGEVRAVAATAFDFTTLRQLASAIRDGIDAQIAIARGYDHNFVLDKGTTATPEFAARLEDPASGRVVEVFTTEPGLQLYSGNALDGTVIGKRGALYRMGDGIALEPQRFPDAPNQPKFGSVRLDPGEIYRHTMIYRMSVQSGEQ